MELPERMNGDRIAAAYVLLMGLFFLSPFGARRLYSWHDRLLRRLPILTRIPGAKEYYSPESMDVVRWMVGVGACVFGVLGLAGVIRFGFG